MAKSYGKYKNPQLSQRMPQALLDKAEEIANLEGITRTALINKAVEEYCTNIDIKKLKAQKIAALDTQIAELELKKEDYL